MLDLSSAATNVAIPRSTDPTDEALDVLLGLLSDARSLSTLSELAGFVSGKPKHKLGAILAPHRSAVKEECGRYLHIELIARVWSNYAV